MRNHKRIAATLILLALLAACSDDQLRSMAKKAHTGIATLETLDKVKDTFVKNGKMSQAESESFNPYVLKAAKSIRVLNNRVAEVQDKINKLPKDEQFEAKKKAILAAIDFKALLHDARESADELIGEGVLVIKNDDVRRAVRLALAGLEGF